MSVAFCFYLSNRKMTAEKYLFPIPVAAWDSWKYCGPLKGAPVLSMLT